MTIEIKYGPMADGIQSQLIDQGIRLSDNDGVLIQRALDAVSFLYIHEFISSTRCRDIRAVIHKRIVNAARPLPKEAA